VDKLTGVGLFCLVLLLIAGPAIAGEQGTEHGPWEKGALNLGVFVTSTNSALLFGSSAGVSIDAEELLGMDPTNYVFRIDGLWRFTSNRKHRLDLSWFSLKRTSENTIGQTIEIPKLGEGGYTTLPAGTKVQSYFDFDIYEVAYSYSFVQDDRLDLAAKLGLYVMPMSFGLKATGILDEEGEAKFTAPLPTLGFRMDVALTPKWFLRNGAGIFYLKYEQFKGTISTLDLAVEYVPWQHFGIGLGLDSFRMSLGADGEDYPGVDFRGKVEFNYVGLQLYGKAFF